MFNKLISLVWLALLMMGCNSYYATKIPYDSDMTLVTVIKNPEIEEDEFRLNLENSFRACGILVHTVDSSTFIPSNEYTIRYEADFSWGMVNYLMGADVYVYKDYTLVGHTRYRYGEHWYAFTSLDLFTKFRSVERKMTPAFDALLQNFKRSDSL